MGQESGQVLREQDARKIARNTTILTLILLAVGLLVVWVAQKQLDIKGDAVYVALLLVPVVVYLLITGQLGELKFGGMTLSLSKQLEGVHKDVVDVGEQQPERSTYLGKLRQVQVKDGLDFYLIYADVESLRSHARRLYLQQDGVVAGNSERRSEKEIRDGVIRNLGLFLTDALYEVVLEEKGAKHDIFFLEEPDIAMIVRKVTREEARKIAAAGAQKFFDRFGWQAKTVVLRPSSEMAPRELDKAAATRLAESSQ